jgi:hypothetical protein
LEHGSDASNVSDSEGNSANREPRSKRLNEKDEPADAVEAALADALRGATAAGQWETVAALARELQARREARAGTVDLNAERTRRGRS